MQIMHGGGNGGPCKMDFGLGRLKQQVSGPSSGLAHANRVAECCVSDSGRGKRAGDDITENQMFRRAVRAAAVQIFCAVRMLRLRFWRFALLSGSALHGRTKMLHADVESAAQCRGTRRKSGKL